MKRLAITLFICIGCGGGSPFGNGDGGNTNDGGTGGDGGTDGGNPVVCDSSMSQPDLCAYGEYCDLTTCKDVQVGTCSNFPTTHSTKSWSFTTSTGPIIYSAVDEATDIAADCLAGTPFTVTLAAYTTTTWPMNKSNLPGFFYVNTSGTETDIPNTLLKASNYTVSADMKNATFKFTLCSTTATTSLVAGFYFTGGNPFCVTLTH